MGRHLSFILCIAFVFMCVPCSFAETKGTAERIDSFSASTSEMTIDNLQKLYFTANIVTDNGRRTDAAVYDNDGKKVADMYDNGEHGDIKANDGIYTACFIPDVKSRKTVSYHAEADGIVSDTREVIYYHMMTTKEIVMHEKFWAEAEDCRQKLHDAGKSPQEILDCMYDFVKSDKYVKADTISYSDNYVFTFEFIWGSAGYIEEYSLAGDDETENTASDTALSALSDEIIDASWTDPDFMVFRPYRQSPYMGDFINEFYTGKAQAVCDITGGEMKDFQEQEAYPGNLKDIDQYGFFIIDSHGETYGGKSYMDMRKGDTSQYDYAADLSARHIIASGYDVGVTGSFFTKYIKNEGKSMPGTLLYLVVCLGMATDTICDPALDCGAQLVYGYTESVSFDWDFEFSETLWETFVSVNPAHPERTYTFQEAMEEAIRVNGSVDPYSVGNTADRGRARPRAKGNTDFVLRVESADPVIGFRILNKDIELYTAETEKIQYQVISEGNTRYTVAFASADESVATVDDGIITLISTEIGAETTIKATLTDLSDKQNPKEFTAECKVCGLGILSVEDINVNSTEIEVYEHTQGTQINAHVLPENATYKELVYKSSDESVITVDETGWVTPVSAGKAYVTVSSAENVDIAKTVTCTVKELTLETAINAPGGALSVENDEKYPFVPGTDTDGNPFAMSSNQKKDSTSSGFTLDAGRMEKGSYITFDWMVSSEAQDLVRFYVNDMPVDSISGKTEWTTYKYEITETDDYVFRIAYIKDSQMSANDDTAYVRNLELYKYGEKHTVNFYDMDRETLLASVEVEHGAAAVPPTAPEHEGYVFEGWSRNTDRVLTDLNVYAVCTEDSTQPLMGDVNGDGLINTSDAVVVLKYVAEMITLDENRMKAADTNRDGKVNTSDAVLIMKYAAGMITEF